MNETTKIITGWVEQIFNKDGQCISQRFKSNDEVTYINRNEDIKVDTDQLYFPLDMIQPK